MNVEVFLQIMVNVFTREWKNIRGKRACFRQEFAMPFGAPRWLTAVLLLVCGLLSCVVTTSEFSCVGYTLLF